MYSEIQWMEKAGLEKEHRASVVCLGTQTGNGRRKFALPPTSSPEKNNCKREAVAMQRRKVHEAELEGEG